jgi:NAD(P)-dependent dehydrogenase (short-subunit alcohol dehydrogenase family)
MGKAIAKRFAREGFNIAMLARRASELNSLAAILSGNDITAKGYGVNLIDIKAMKIAFTSIENDFGPANVLVYNAAQWNEIPAMAINPSDFNRDMALCVTGALVCSQFVYSGMKKARNGTIIFTGGGLALYPDNGAGVSSLTAGKSALRGFTYALAKELAADNIHVASVTIAGTVKHDSAFDPDRIADTYWDLHCEAPGAWTVERVYDGK